MDLLTLYLVGAAVFLACLIAGTYKVPRRERVESPIIVAGVLLLLTLAWPVFAPIMIVSKAEMAARGNV